MAKIVPFREGIGEALKVLRSGGAIAYPTETVYGLGADPWDRNAVERIYRIKGRPKEKRFLLVVSDVGMLKGLVGEVPNAAEALMRRFWPGPLTLVLRAGPEAPPWCGETVAVRAPGHPGVRELVARFGKALISTSANRSSEPPARTAGEVAERLGEEVDLILDGGLCSGLPSTIVDLSGESPRILRRGDIKEEDIAPFLADYHPKR
ncbi:MAG: threonylcarbamoyl-AMP synthase [Candidatus Latescibacterota bacterium]|nr:MAG: threonylcarbamoyl-AMP synthase [Candidatus Latescibacterota bacterium]